MPNSLDKGFFRTEKENSPKLTLFLLGLSLRAEGGAKGITLPAPTLIIPIIMACNENVINNTEDIVVAISHMVVGLCSGTILPLASTYVCQRRAAMTNSSSAHLALPTERCTWGMLSFLSDCIF